MMTAPTGLLTVVVPPELASGFRLAGVVVQEAADAAAAEAIVDALIGGGERGIAGVYAPFHAELDAATQERYERSTEPIVMPLPAGLERADAGTHRARIAAMLERAIGYHISFPQEAGA